MSFWRRLFSLRHHHISRFEPLDSTHAADLADLHAAGGFARAWSTAECEALLADRSVIADAAFHDGAASAPRKRRVAIAHAAILSRLAHDEAEVLVIAVDPAYRAQGLATRLMRLHGETLARRGVKRWFLEVAENNMPARALYARLGFVEAGSRPGYYPLPDGGRASALILRRELG